MTFHGLSLPSRVLLPWDKQRHLAEPRSSSTERGEDRRRLDSSSEVSAYIDLYTSRDPSLAVALGENARPAPAPFIYDQCPRAPEFLPSNTPRPNPNQNARVPLQSGAIRLPLPGFDQYSPLPTETHGQGSHAPQVGDDTSATTPAASSPPSPSSSDYPSEGIRSEDCVSPPGEPFGPLLATAPGGDAIVKSATTTNDDDDDDGDDAALRSRNLNLSDLSQYCWPGRRGAVRSLLRSSSLTDASGPHERNVSTNLLDELAAADGLADACMDAGGSSSDDGGSMSLLEDKNGRVEVIHTDRRGDGEDEDVEGEEGGVYVVPEASNKSPAVGDQGWWTLGRDGGNKTVGKLLGIGRRGIVAGKAGDRKKLRRKFRLGKWVRKAIKRTKSEFFRKGVQELLMRDKVKKGGQVKVYPK